MSTPKLPPDQAFVQACSTLEEAVDWVHWLNFSYRNRPHTFGVVDGPEHYAAVNQVLAQELDTTFLSIPPVNYAQLSIAYIQRIGSQADPAPFWLELMGMIATLDGQVLRYILAHQLPLYKLIRVELANRGCDEQGAWCGFDRASAVWLSEV